MMSLPRLLGIVQLTLTSLPTIAEIGEAIWSGLVAA
jgi:hypothetical protein